MNKITKIILSTIILAGIRMIVPSSASAIAKSWDGGASTATWSDANNWNPDGAPGSTDDVTINQNVTVNLTAATTINSLTLGQSGGGTTPTLNFSYDAYAVAATNITTHLIIHNGATLTHSVGTNVVVGRINLVIGGDFTLQNGGSVNLASKGFRYSEGTGQGADAGGGYASGGGGYGGAGGKGTTGTSTITYRNGGTIYGNVSDPIDLGSGAGQPFTASSGAYGGGSIKLVVTGTSIINGVINVNGGDGNGDGAGNASGGGSGGTVNLTTNVLTGSTGSITANGGSGKTLCCAWGGGGGGGRISLKYVTNNTYSGTQLARGGSGPTTATNGGAGTIFTQLTGQNGDLIIDNNGITGDYTDAATYLPGTGTYNSLTITNYAVFRSSVSATVVGDLTINNNAIFETTTGGNLSYGNFTWNTGVTLIDNGGTFNYLSGGGSVVQPISSTWVANTARTYTSVTVQGTLIHSANSTAETYKINLTTSGNFTISNTATVNLNGLGFDQGLGPGKGSNGAAMIGSGGGGFGGVGGNGSGSGTALGGPTYGTSTLPTNIGSGAGIAYGARNVAKGGGAIILTVGGILTTNTAISVNGSNGSGSGAGDADGGGSAGTISLTASELAGTGNLNAVGGNGMTLCCSWGGGGGGGRIYLSYSQKTWNGVASAAGGTVSGGNAGNAGTIIENGLPQNPSSLSQLKSNGTTVISAGEITDETTVVLKTTMAAGTSITLTPEFEVQPSGTSFTNVASNTGSGVAYSGTPVIGSVTISGLSDLTNYHWQVRICGNGACSSWVSNGGSPYDFGVFLNVVPATPTNLGQESYVNGSYGSDSTPTLAFTLDDENPNDQVFYTIQVSMNSDFDPTVIEYISPFISQGASTFTVGQLTGSGVYMAGTVGQSLSNGSYYWRVKATDSSGATSAWASAGSGGIAFRVDATPPSTNASNIVSTTTTHNGWAYEEPNLSWTSGVDTSGILGYCVAVSEGNIGESAPTEDPSSTGGLLGGLDDGVSASFCPFIVTGTSLSLSTVSGLSLTPNKQYYISIKVVDNAGNFFAGSASEFRNLFTFKFDNTLPVNVSSISAAGGTFSNIADMYFSWPTSGTIAASDGESGILGYQYSLNDQTHWTGITIDNATGLSVIPVSTTTPFYLNVSRDSTQIVVGANIIYFRTVDIAGNTSSSSTYRTASIVYGGDAPTFTPDASITVTPSIGTENSFALEWDAASPATGRTITSYYWMVNTVPPATLQTMIDNPGTYFEATSLSVSSGALPAVVRGVNNVYVVAIDDLNNYSPSSYISSSFTLNTTSPDAPKDVTVSDASIKSASLWRASLAWGTPDYVGLGDLIYTVQRSSDGNTWSTVGTTSGTAYVDTVSNAERYYWRVGTKDSGGSGNSSPSYSNAVTLIPKGSFTSSADLTSGPVVTNITTKKAKITWTTNRASDSKVSYGSESGKYQDEEPSNSNQVTDHTINLTNLSPGATYYYKAKWTDEDGNTGTSSEKTFSTASAPSIKEASVSTLSIDSAIITFTSHHANKVKLYYGKSADFGGSKEVETATTESTYTVIMSDLDDGTKYYYRLNSFDSEGAEYTGEIHSFETLPRPRISTVTLQQVADTAETAVLVKWQSNTEISSIVTVSSEGLNSREVIDLTLRDGDHSMVVMGLMPKTDYLLVVKGRDLQGNEAVSAPIAFTTASDTRPPAIINLKVVGGTIPPVGFAAGTVNAQLVVSWDTDEPATSQVEYGEGTGSEYSSKSSEDNNLTTNHVVVISGLTPSQVYHLRAISKDSAGNDNHSVDSVTIAPKATRSALDLVMSNLSQIFGGISLFQR